MYIDERHVQKKYNNLLSELKQINKVHAVHIYGPIYPSNGLSWPTFNVRLSLLTGKNIIKCQGFFTLNYVGVWKTFLGGKFDYYFR